VLVPFGGGRTAPLDLRRVPLRWTGMRLAVDVTSLRLAVYDGRRLLASFSVGAGAPATPTPRGRFTVTDRVSFPAGGPYGPLALGISVRQRHLPASWTGGDQVAIHGTNEPWSIGRRVSLGCIRVPDWALRLLRRVPLGAPVVVSS
jgi:lipoprotein-anchoring transpeptidase ErfK/SrfK